MTKSGRSSTARAELDDERSSERRIAVRAASSQPSDEKLKRAVIAFARSQQPSPQTRERILSQVLAALGLEFTNRKVDQ